MSMSNSEKKLREALAAPTQEEAKRLLAEGVALLKSTKDEEGEWVDDPYIPGLVVWRRFDGYPEGYEP